MKERKHLTHEENQKELGLFKPMEEGFGELEGGYKEDRASGIQ